MTKLFNSTSIAKIKELVELNLLKRNITAELLRLEETQFGIEVETDEFNTIPMFFDKLWAETWGTDISPSEKGGHDFHSSVRVFWIMGNANNQKHLFTIRGHVLNGKLTQLYTD